MKQRLRLTNALILGLFVLLMFNQNMSRAADQTQYSGQWEGFVKFTSVQPRIVLNFEKSKDGTMNGKISLPDQDEMDMPVSNLQIEGNSISFDMENGRATASFKGTLKSGSGSITGDFTQAGQTYPFELKAQNSKMTKADK